MEISMEWRAVPIVGQEHRYEVSDTGLVRSKITHRLLAQQNGGGKQRPHRKHRMVGLCIDGRAKTFQVHRLIAIAFISPPPSPEHQVNHRNGRANDNRVTNLEWMLPSENTAHARRLYLAARGARHGRYTKPGATPRGVRHWNAKLNDGDVRAIRVRAAAGEMIKDIAADYNVSGPHVSEIVSRKTWAHVPDEPPPEATSAARAAARFDD